MKAQVLRLLIAGAVAGLPGYAGSADPVTVCIRALDIDHTKAPDNRTILFYMKNGQVWSTTLTSYCPELSFNGFVYGPTPPDDICGNMQTIRVIRSGAICEMGPLVPVSARNPGP